MTSEASKATDPKPSPPTAERRPHEISAHGDTRVDDWYWVNERKDPAVRALLEAENAHTAAATQHLQPLIEDIYDTMLSRVQLTDVTYPAPKGQFAYYTRTIDGQEHGVYCRRPVDAPLPVAQPSGHDEFEQVVIDQNALAEGHDYFEVEASALSEDQSLLAYGVDLSGGLRLTLYVKDLSSGELLPEVIDNTQAVAFAGNHTIFYTRPDDALRPYQVWRHKLGEEPSTDVLVWEEPDESYFLDADSTKDGKYVVLSAHSRETSESRLVPTEAPETEPTLVAARTQDVEYSIEHHRGELLILSNAESENFVVYRAPVSQPGRENWKPLVAARDDIRLESLDVLDGFAIIEERGHATTAIRLVPLDDGGAGAGGTGNGGTGNGAIVIEAPEASALFAAENGDFAATTLRYHVTSLIQPRTLYSYDLMTGSTTELHRQPAPNYDPTNYATERRWVKSADGTEVPVTLAWATKRPEGAGPALLYGYGSYEASIDPTYRNDRPIHPLLDRGFVYAIAHVRGGGELARQWFVDGRRASKPNSFQDFVAVAHWMVAEGLTQPDLLAATGRSAGGLLMGASVNLDPAAFGCVVAEVPFVDCLTTMLDTSLPLTVIEREDWGDPLNDIDAYNVIKSYSPYDNIKATRYPLILATTGFNDPMVSYFEPTKWVQKLRAAHPDNPERVFLKAELVAGHMGPSGRYHHWKDRAFVMAFIVDAVTPA